MASTEMKTFMLVGLGNPGKEYEFTRHNAGKLFVRYLAEHPVEGIEAIETECYMNESGSWLQRALQSRGLWDVGSGLRVSYGDAERPHSPQLNSQLKTHNAQLIIAHDDLDISVGSFKIQFGKGPRQHKGILSIEAALRTTEFWRVRIGIEARKKEEGKREKEISGEEYVLQLLSKEERKILEALFPEVRERLQTILRQ